MMTPLPKFVASFVRRVGGLLLAVMALASCARGQSLSLVWSDEFNSVTSSNVDTTKWSFDTGDWGWGNHEFENYTSRTNNAYVAGGLLHIRAQTENTTPPSITSARLKTQGHFATHYGRIEWRAKLPGGVGMWPALWLLGDNITEIGWPRCGEIDVVENNGATITFDQGSLHSGSDEWKIFNFTGGDSVTNFHVYDLDWTSNSFTWSVDGHPYETQTDWTSVTGKPYPFPFNQDFYLLMNLATGGDFIGNPSRESVTANLPNELLIDYVRVYQFVPTPPH